MASDPLVAVITLNWNGSGFLKECVDSVLASSYSNFQVIIVDNGSTDDSLRLLEESYGDNEQITVLKNDRNLGYSLGMNVGLREGFEVLHADYCLVMNNDTRLDSNALSALVRVAVSEPAAGFVTGKVYYYDNPDTFQTVGKKSHPVFVNGGHIGRGEVDRGQYDQDRELAFCDDIFWLVSRNVYEATGGYDPEFFLQAEDFDWQLRAKKAEYKIFYAHTAKIWHKESMTIGKMSPQKVFYDTRNPIIAIAKNCEPKDVQKYFKERVYRVLIPSIFKNLLKGNFKSGFAIARGLISVKIWQIKQGSINRSTGISGKRFEEK